jgi:hypothetical protein
VFLPVIGDFTLVNLLVFAVGLIIIWIIVSIPVYIAAKLFMPDASFQDAMVATIFGPIIYVVTLFGVDYFLGAAIGSQGYIWALILAFIAWVFVFKVSFRTGWLRAPVIALIAILVFAFVSFLFGFFLGVMVQPPFFPLF